MYASWAITQWKDAPSVWVGVASQKRNHVAQELGQKMAGEQLEKRRYGAVREVPDGARGHPQFVHDWFNVGLGMAGDKVGKSVLETDGRAFCEGSGSHRLLMAQRALLAVFFLSYSSDSYT